MMYLWLALLPVQFIGFTLGVLFWPLTIYVHIAELVRDFQGLWFLDNEETVRAAYDTIANDKSISRWGN